MNLSDIAKLVSELKPGEAIIVDKTTIELLKPNVNPLGAAMMLLCHLPTDPIDQIMEKIVGSSYDIIPFEDPISGDVHFRRLKQPLKDGSKTWVSPDRRHLYEYDGWVWNRNEEAIREHYENNKHKSTH